MTRLALTTVVTSARAYFGSRTQAPNWTRFVCTPGQDFGASPIAFFTGELLVAFFGGVIIGEFFANWCGGMSEPLEHESPVVGGGHIAVYVVVTFAARFTNCNGW